MTSNIIDRRPLGSGKESANAAGVVNEVLLRSRGSAVVAGVFSLSR
jgi:hypothetical protein